MTKLLDQALEVARSLPAELQDDIARVVLQLTGDDDVVVGLSDDERAAIERSKDAAKRGAFASDEDVRALWAKYNL
ncbi:hypothetical protein KQX63_04775 [Rhodopseudomonas palustris]|uniref:hypothetical protein n=1 Tax=Rhodopseudomonas palustris TaxID=1076 RepID=UPI0021F31701|nr:hypothetical protein [Rhodopseudomonas palustris]UYO45342.1 hypothetical protein KQX63_04775 [Rhodopseudomonas palustris]UYO54765.1 hypothetical protein KQX61_04950 [Rhodopseudomonas palustris]